MKTNNDIVKILLPTEVAASGAESQLSFNSSRSTDSLPKVAEVAKKGEQRRTI